MWRRFWRVLEKTKNAKETVTTLPTVTNMMVKMDYEQAAQDLSRKYAWQDEMMAQQYSKFQANFSDVNEETYRELAYGGKFPENLSPTSQLPTPLFPATGKIFNTERRLMIPLAIRFLPQILRSYPKNNNRKEVKNPSPESRTRGVFLVGKAYLACPFASNFISEEFRLVKYYPELFIG